MSSKTKLISKIEISNISTNFNLFTYFGMGRKINYMSTRLLCTIMASMIFSASSAQVTLIQLASAWSYYNEEIRLNNQDEVHWDFDFNAGCFNSPETSLIDNDDDDCPSEGEPCDDGNACTENDVIDADCNCQGSYINGEEEGDIATYISNIIDNLPGSTGDDYMTPEEIQMDTWNSVLDSILAQNINGARAIACDLNYKIKEFTDNTITPSQVFYVLEEMSPQTHYWGTYVFSKTPKIGNLILQAPHAIHDTNTGDQATHCFKNNVARALFINGTQRCNHSEASLCSGTTSVCGGNQAYKISDLAHNVNSIYQKSTENLFFNLPTSIFIQLHGFKKLDSDPYVIISNGTQETPEVDYAALLRDALELEDPTLTFELPHINTDWDRLRGFSNTQGRLINNSDNHCTQNADNTTGRFLHVEQEKSKLRENITGWTKMSNALATVFGSDCEIDSDGDGICDSDDVCPGFDDNQDEDNDNIPDGCDPCNENLANTPCDDGDGCTQGEMYDVDCNCIGGVYTDNDGDGYCVGTDPDDSDACNPDVNSSACYQCDPIISDGFENDLGNWIDGGGDAYLSSLYANTGDHSMRLRDNSGSSSSIYTDVLDMTAYDLLQFSFSFYAVEMEIGEDFLFEISTDGGNSFDVIDSWVRGTDFENDIRYDIVVDNIDVEINNTMVFRLRCDASSDNDMIYLDDIVLSDCPIDCSEGEPCNDGDECTINDTYNSDCDCIGDAVSDSDGDGFCDVVDVCPGQDDALIGLPCDDNDICTMNDVYNNDCICAGQFMDNDEDGYCVGEDPDDTDACTPDPNHVNCTPCDNIIFDSFELGYGNWNDGGSDAARVTSNAYTGEYSVRLRDNSTSSHIATDNLNLTAYDEVSVEFTYYPKDMEAGEDFFLEISTDGGDNYSIEKTWTSEVDFEDQIRYFEEVIISDMSFTSTTRIRLRCDASSNSDMVYFDDVLIKGCTTNNQARQAGKTSTKRNDLLDERKISVYPNPARHALHIDCEALQQKHATLTLSSATGERVRTIELKGSYQKDQVLNLQGLQGGIYILLINDDMGELVVAEKVLVL